VHDPVGATALWGTAAVVNKRLLHSNGAVAVGDGTVFPGGLPVAPLGGAVGPGAVSVLAIQRAEEVPLQVLRLQLRQS